MIPIRLQISGFLSYLEPVELDFTGFSVACISGHNGAGKSSLLDAITWVLFGNARRRDDTLINSHAKAAEVTLDFHYEGNDYRVMRSKPRDKATVLEFFLCGADGAWRPLTEKSMRETEARIQNILRMDYETFTNASFFLQGKADQFSQQRAGDRKKVLSAILGLEVWEEYKENASARRKEAELEIRTLDGQLKEIEDELAQENERKERLERAEAQLAATQALSHAKESALVSMQRLAATMGEQKRLVDVLERSLNESELRYTGLRKQLERLEAEQAAFQQVLEREGDVTAAYQRWQDLRAELARWDETAVNFREIEARRAEPLTLIATEEARLQQERQALYEQDLLVLREEGRLPDLRAQLAMVVSQLKKLEEAQAGRGALETELQEVQQHVANARAENATLKEAMNSHKERIDRLSKAEGAACPLCGQPLSQYERAALVESLGVEGKEMGDRYRANQELLGKSESRFREIQGKLSGVGRLDDEMRATTRQHDRIEAELVRIELGIESWRAGGKEKGAGRLAEVVRIITEGDFAREARERLALIDAESKALGYDSAAHDAVRRAEVDARASQEAMRSLEQAKASLLPLERQVTELRAQLVTEGARFAEQEESYHAARLKYEAEVAQLPDVDKAEREVYDLKTESNRLRMEVGRVKQQVEVLDTLRVRKAALQDKRDVHSLQAARLRSLERAFSKDGVPALLIEQALPEIETQANEILDKLSAGNMSVHFETQRQFKDKSREDRRETLDILISDANGLREYELFSGGEAFRVNFAIRMALSRVLAQRAGARLQTLVIDEGFGSQDAEGRQRLIEVINQIRPEFEKILVVTHLEELKEAFPARIEVEKGPTGSQVRVIA